MMFFMCRSSQMLLPCVVHRSRSIILDQTPDGNIFPKGQPMIFLIVVCCQKMWMDYCWPVDASQPVMMHTHLYEAWDNAWPWVRQQEWQLLRQHINRYPLGKSMCVNCKMILSDLARS